MSLFKKLKIWFLFLVFLTNISILFGQQVNLDSLKAIALNTNIHDTIRVNTIGTIIDNTYEGKDTEYFNELIRKIVQKNLKRNDLDNRSREIYTMYLAAYHNNMSSYYSVNRPEKAIVHAEKAIKTFRSIGYEAEANFCLVGKAIVLTKLGNYKEAIDLYYEALRYYELKNKDDLDGISYVYSNLATIFENQKEYKTSVKFLKKAIFYLYLKINNPKNPKSLEDYIQICNYKINLGNCYKNLNNNYLSSKYFSQALAIGRKTKQNSYASKALTMLAALDIEQNKFDDAKLKLKEAQLLAENNLSKALASLYLGKVYYLEKKYDEALNQLESGMNIVEETQNNNLRIEGYELLYLINKENGNLSKSISYLENFHELKDSLESKENTNRLKQEQLKFEFEKREFDLKFKAEKQNTNKNRLLFGLSFLLFTILVVVYFFYKNYKQKQILFNYEKNELRQKLLLSQMNPHFIFNSIDTIQSLIYLNQSEEAINYLGKFSQLTRQILENSGESYIGLDEEVSMIKNYLSIQKLLFENKFVFNIKIDVKEELEKLFVPPMLMQPFIENAIKHGAIKVENGKVEIKIELKNDALIFLVSDNGNGFTKTKSLKQQKSKSTRLTEERLRLLTKSNGIKIHYKENSEGGTTAWFEVPYIYEK